MASMTMTASFLGSQAPVTAHRRLVVVASAARGANAEGEKVSLKVEASNGRRDLMFAAAAAAACSVAGIALAAEEPPKAGTPEARKFYAPICVTMPTAKACHK